MNNPEIDELFKKADGYLKCIEDLVADLASNGGSKPCDSCARKNPVCYFAKECKYGAESYYIQKEKKNDATTV